MIKSKGTSSAIMVITILKAGTHLSEEYCEDVHYASEYTSDHIISPPIWPS